MTLVWDTPETSLLPVRIKYDCLPLPPCAMPSTDDACLRFSPVRDHALYYMLCLWPKLSGQERHPTQELQIHILTSYIQPKSYKFKIWGLAHGARPTGFSL